MYGLLSFKVFINQILKLNTSFLECAVSRKMENNRGFDFNFATRKTQIMHISWTVRNKKKMGILLHLEKEKEKWKYFLELLNTFLF